MEVGLAVGGAFLSSTLNVLFDRLASLGSKAHFLYTLHLSYVLLMWCLPNGVTMTSFILLTRLRRKY
ncbi:hypothetical protein H5410_058667 [Solanum commersonii]|uniref:Uncharacterized protein n=1 Tax=Solanum commersonii TaxID=4109 RepID=A0A9J5WTD4_SOLCO|nr:hypothetical protein H5410_058667 [Solanum commersonii]